MFDFESILERMDKAGNDYAEAKSISWNLQELKGIALAQAIKSVFEKEPKASFQRAENEAKTSEAYRTHLAGTSAAIEREYKTKCIYEKIQCEFEAARSLFSLEKKQRGTKWDS